MKTNIRIAALAALALLAGCASAGFTPYDAAGTDTRLPVALVSMETNLSPDTNRATIESYVARIMADHPDVRLISFGEASLGWYYKPGDPAGYQRTVAERIDGTTVTLIRKLAKQYGVYLSLGFSELEDGKVYDAAVIIDDTGSIIAHRDKSNFVVFDWLNGYTAGERSLTTALVDNIKVAFLICNDLNDRAYQAAAVADVQIKVLILPQASSGLRSDEVKTKPTPFPGIWFLAPQRYGREGLCTYYGSWIIDPNGYMVTSADSPGYSYYVLGIR